MAEFTYTALNSAGKEVKGNIDAENQTEAVTKIKAKGITPLKVESANALNKSMDFNFLQAKPKPKDLSVFCRQMVSILSAGVPMAEALGMLSEQTQNKVLQNAISGCKQKISGGMAMSEAMKDYKCFDGIFATMIAAGEQSGDLETAFNRMAERLEKSTKTKALVSKATMYPKIIGVVAVVVVVFMLAFIVPKFEGMLADMGSEMPALTQVIINMSDFVQNNYIILIAAVIGVVVGLGFFKKTDFGLHLFAKIGLKAPLIGKLTVRQSSSNCARTMATMLAAGLPMLESIEITANVMTNVYFKEALLAVKKDVTAGATLSESLANTKMFPSMLCHMIHIGEETGDIVSMLERTADYYDEEVKETTEQVTGAIEPLVIVLLAGVVGTIVVALFMPIISMYGSMDSL